MFAKYWAPGQVKTRLAASLGDATAAEIYHAFLQTLVTRCSSTGTRRVVAFAPSDRRAAFEELATPTWELAVQQGSNLGERMHHYFSEAFAAGIERAVLIGSDSPNLPLPIINQAFAALANAPVVLGPSDDGGYYLIGASGGIPAVFDDITWSSSHVWDQTIARLESNNTRYAVLPSWYDVDDIDDLRRLQTELANPSDPALERLRRELEAIVGGVSA